MTKPAVILSVLRAGLGVGAWVAPGLVLRSFGIDTRATPSNTYLARLFGIRDVVLAGFVLGTSGEARALALRLGVVCDVVDTVAAIDGRRTGALTAPTAVKGAATALGAAGLGALALRSAAQPEA